MELSNRLRLAATLAMAVALGPTGASAQAYDVVILNGRIVDGTGAPWYRGDLAIKDGRIAVIGRLRAGDRVVFAAQKIDGDYLLAIVGARPGQPLPK